MAEVRIEHVSKSYAGVRAVDDVSLTVRDNEFMVLLGPSGCGKTSLLRTIAGLEVPDGGAIFINGRDVTDLAPRKRGISMVFQSYALFPHLCAFDNVAFGLHMHHVSRAETERRVRKVADLMQIGALLRRYPSQLSGGQRQRVAVARALVTEPAVMLMDEPLSNLDALLRLQMRAELKHLLQKVSATTIYVTHDQVEALSMGDRTAVMRDGAIVQCAPPMEVYDRPDDVFVAQFIGTPPMNVLRGTVIGGGVDLEGMELRVNDTTDYELGDRVNIGIRAENIETCSQPALGHLKATVQVVEPLGSYQLLTVGLGDQVLKISVHNTFHAEPGGDIGLKFPPQHLRLLGRAD